MALGGPRASSDGACRRLGAACVLAVLVLCAGATSADADERERAWLGIAMGAAADGAGVPVEHVIHGSPAEKGGLRADDRILQVDGVAAASPRDVVRAVAAHAVGETTTLTISRSGKAQRVVVVLAGYPSTEAILRMDHVGIPAPTWAGLQPTSGFPSTLEGLLGRVVLVDFWATWCGPCRELAPILGGWQARYGAQGLTVVGITTDSPEVAASFRERLALRFPMASDPRATTSMAYGVSALPTMYVVDRRGLVREVVVGADADQDARIEALIQTLLAEPAAKP